MTYTSLFLTVLNSKGINFVILWLTPNGEKKPVLLVLDEAYKCSQQLKTCLYKGLESCTCLECQTPVVLAQVTILLRVGYCWARRVIVLFWLYLERYTIKVFVLFFHIWNRVPLRMCCWCLGMCADLLSHGSIWHFYTNTWMHIK